MYESPFVQGVRVIVVYPNGYAKFSTIQTAFKNGNFFLEGDVKQQWHPQVRYRNGRPKWFARVATRKRWTGELIPTVFVDTPEARDRLSLRHEDDQRNVYPGRSGESKGAA